MADELIYSPNNDTQNTLSIAYNACLKRLYTQIKIQINQNSIKVPKVVNQRIRKRYY